MRKKQYFERHSTFYLKNGIQYNGIAPFTEDQKVFYIQINENETKSYSYPGDSILYRIDSEIAMFGEDFRRLIFPDDNSYYSEIKELPMFVVTAGLSSDSGISKESFERILCIQNLQQKYKPHFYLADVQYLISSVQNLIIGMNANFIDFYRLLSDVNMLGIPSREHATYVVRGETAERIISTLSSYFVKMYSIMDLTTKIAYEFENPCSPPDIPSRLRSNKILYNNKNRLRHNGIVSTIFDKDPMLTEIETLRNEIVHNGMWEDGGKIFVDTENGSIIARYVLYPDMEEGRFVSYANRHHFFSKGIKVNDVLPSMHIEFLTRLFNTIFHLRNDE